MQRKGTLPACPAAPLGKAIKVDPAIVAAAVAAGMGPGSGAPTPGCPLGCVHPPPGEECTYTAAARRARARPSSRCAGSQLTSPFLPPSRPAVCLGCSICREAATF